VTGQVTADDALRFQLAALLHVETCENSDFYDGDDCIDREHHERAADAVLSWLLSQGTTEWAIQNYRGEMFPASSEAEARSWFGATGDKLQQRRVVSVSSVWTTVEGTP